MEKITKDKFYRIIKRYDAVGAKIYLSGYPTYKGVKATYFYVAKNATWYLFPGMSSAS